MDWKSLKPYARSETQLEIINSLIETDSQRKTAKLLGKSRGAVRSAVKIIRDRAARQGWSPEHDFTKVAPDGFTVKGVSSLYDGDGMLRAQWVKTSQEKERQEAAFIEYIEGLAKGIKGAAKPTRLPKGKYASDLMSAIILGDAHIGQRAENRETLGMDFDTDIAVKDIRDAIDNLVDRSPNAETGVLVDVGDVMHANSSEPFTAQGTRVDVDTRYSRVLKMTGMVMRYSIDRMLQKFKYVKVVISKGNHSPDAAIALALMLQFYYDKEKRVRVLDTIGSFHYVTHGRWLIGVNHGNKIKAEKLVSVMARDHPGWSAAKFRIWLTGHVHHELSKEIDGCTVRSFNTLAPREAWHSSMGYGARQSMTLMTFHKTKGMHSTLEYDLPMEDRLHQYG